MFTEVSVPSPVISQVDSVSKALERKSAEVNRLLAELEEKNREMERVRKKLTDAQVMMHGVAEQ